MRQFAYLLILVAVFTTPVFLAGCGSIASSTPVSNNADHDHDDHDHTDHNHD